MPGEEEYMALERGVLDGNATGADNAVNRKLYEVLGYACTTPISMGSFVFIMNKDFWNGLPADIQATIDKINAEESAAHLVAHQAESDKAWKELAQRIELTTLTPEETERWRKQVAPVGEAWVKKMAAEGLPGKEAVEVLHEITGK
jgi:C4-dicarboxylate-binding protein DctP